LRRDHGSQRVWLPGRRAALLALMAIQIGFGQPIVVRVVVLAAPVVIVLALPVAVVWHVVQWAW
jgi:hypothetical protein